MVVSRGSRPDWSGRLRRLQSLLGPDAALGADGLVVSTPLNIAYLTGFTGTSGLLLVSARAVALITDGRYVLLVRQAIDADAVADVPVVEVDKRYDLTLAEVIQRDGHRRVAFEAGHLTMSLYAAWTRNTPGVEWVATERVVERMRSVKDSSEIEVFRRGGRLISDVAANLSSVVRQGSTEREIAAGIDAMIVRAGFSRPAFPTIVASGPNSALPHARPTDRMLAPGDLVVLDFGGVLDGYCLDLTRMAAVGSISGHCDSLFSSVLAANRAGIEAVRPGVQASDIDRAARDVLEARGLGGAFLHSTGHGLGLEVHESPRVGRADANVPEVVEPGMVMTIEPGAYVEGVGGVRIEDDVLVTPTGSELLTHAPRELLVV